MATTTDEARTFSDKLRAALRAKDVSVRMLAKRMATKNGTALEQERRRVHRYLAEPPMLATEQSRRLIEECLELTAGSLDADEDDEESDEMYARLLSSLRAVVRTEIAAERQRQFA